MTLPCCWPNPEHCPVVRSETGVCRHDATTDPSHDMGALSTHQGLPACERHVQPAVHSRHMARPRLERHHRMQACQAHIKCSALQPHPPRMCMHMHQSRQRIVCLGLDRQWPVLPEDACHGSYTEHAFLRAQPPGCRV